MKHLCKRLSIFISALMLVMGISTSVFCIPVKAAQFPFSFWTINLLKKIGLIVDPDMIPGHGLDLDDYYREITGIDPNANVEDTEESVSNWFEDNSTVIQDSNNNYTISMNRNYQTVMKNVANNFMNNCGYKYYYSYRIQDSMNTSIFSDGYLYNALRQLLNDKSDNGWCMYHIPTHKVYYLPFNDDIALVKTNDWGTYTFATFYSYTSWAVAENPVYIFEYDSNAKTYNESVSGNISNTGYVASRDEGQALWSASYTFFTSSGNYNQLLIFDNLTALKKYSQGVKPYYTNDNWNSFVKNNSDNYTLDYSNTNNISYGDITNYINSFNTQNGQYPSNPIINVYINNNVPDAGGGSGGGGSGGGGSGGDDDIGIFDFLSRIGAVLGNLIKNLGQVLAELVEGISQVISSLFESIPTVFNDFLGGIISWLPQELRALITLSISAMVIVGLIKMFKG